MEFSPLFAYLDPGTLTFLMQCLVAAVVGGALSIRMFWTGLKMRISALFGFRKQGVASNEPAGEGSRLSVFSEEHAIQAAPALDSTVSMVSESPIETHAEASPEKRPGEQREAQSDKERRAA